MKAREADGHAAVPGRRGVRPWHAILVIFVVVLAAPAWAQDDDRTRYYLGLRGHGSNPFTEVHDLLGASVGVNVNRYWGFELAAEGFERRLRLDGKALGEYLLLPLVPQVRVRYPLLGGRLTPYALAGVGVPLLTDEDVLIFWSHVVNNASRTSLAKHVFVVRYHLPEGFRNRGSRDPSNDPFAGRIEAADMVPGDWAFLKNVPDYETLVPQGPFAGENAFYIRERTRGRPETRVFYGFGIPPPPGAPPQFVTQLQLAEDMAADFNLSAEGRRRFEAEPADMVWTRLGSPVLDERQRLGDLRVVPAPPVLVLQQDQLSRLVGPGGVPRVVQEHEGEEARDLPRRRGPQQRAEQPCQADGLGAEIGAHERLAARGRVPFGEDEIEDGEDGVEPRRHVRRAGDGVRDAGVADLGLGADEPLGHRRGRHEEGPSDLVRLQAAQRAEREGDLRLGGQCRVAAGEDQPEQVVRDLRRIVVGRRDDGVRAGAAVRLDLLRETRPAADAVDRLVPGGLDDPRAGRSRDTLARPLRHRAREGFLGRLLGQVEVADEPDERGDDPAPVGTVHVGHRGAGIGVRRHEG